MEESMACMINEGEWSSMSGIYNTIEESSDFMALLNDCSVNFSNDHHIGVDSCWSKNDHEDTTMDMSNSLNFSDIYNGGSRSNYHFSGFSHENNNNYYANDENTQQVLGMSENYDGFICMNSETIMGGSSFRMSKTDDVINFDHCLINQEREHAHQVFEKLSLLQEANDNGKSNISKNNKRCLNPNLEKNKRNVKLKKNLKLASSDKNNKEKKVVINSQSSSGCSSKDYCSEITEGITSTKRKKGSLALNSSGKARASRGSATDPQSLYARKRRERISDRLRVLQNLVPNGTKVDMSTMLEEAVQYVKFLQLQIKLLSSDDMWMYAPLAYNGMDIGLDFKINMLNDLTSVDK